jgi:hypothetical protein
VEVDKATASQIANIESRTGKTLNQLVAAIWATGLTKHGEMRVWAMDAFGIGHGDGNLLAHLARAPQPSEANPGGDVLDEIYAGKKAHLRPIHEKLMAAIEHFGDFEVAPKKGYVSLRRKKQFAMLGPKTNERFELGLNLKGDVRDARVKAQPPGGMCQYIAALTAVSEVDAALVAIVKRAYDAAD